MDRADSLRRDRTRPEPIDALDAERVTFDELYERHRLDVYRYLRAWGSSEDEAADLTAAAFERAYRAPTSPRPPHASRAWLVRIARNSAIDAARRRDAASRGLRFWPRGEVAPDPADLVIGDETDRLLARRVAALPAAQREAIVLRYTGGLSARDIGQVLGRTEAAAHKLMNRALRSRAPASVSAERPSLGSMVATNEASRYIASSKT